MISTIGKKLINLQGLPYMPPKFGEPWSTNGWGWLVSFCPPLKFAHRTSCRLTFVTHFGLMFARWRLWSMQMPRACLALVRLRAGRAHAGFCPASSFVYFMFYCGISTVRTIWEMHLCYCALKMNFVQECRGLCYYYWWCLLALPMVFLWALFACFRCVFDQFCICIVSTLLCLIDEQAARYYKC